MKFLSKLLTTSSSRNDLKLTAVGDFAEDASKSSVGCISVLLASKGIEFEKPSSVDTDDEDDSDCDTDSVGSFVACPVMGAVQYVPVAAPTARRRTAMDRGPEVNMAASTPHNTVDGARTAASSGGSSADGAAAITSGDEPPSTSEVERGSVEAQYCGMSLMHRSRNALIYRARERQTDRTVVLKAYQTAKLGAAKREAVEREIRLMRVAEHPGIVRLRSVLENDEYTYLVLEAATGGTLMEAIANQGGRLTEKTAALRVTAPLLRTLMHLHNNGIVHRDIKPEHLLLSPGSGLKLADFHSAARPGVELEAMNYRVGSIEYMAPEMLSKPSAAEVFHLVLSQGMSEEELPVYDHAVDVWSAGVLTYEALTGYQPFLADGAPEMAAVIAQKMAATVNGVPEFIARHKLSPDCQEWLVQALQVDPKQRPSAEQLLQHPWIQRWLATTIRRSIDAVRASLDVASAAASDTSAAPYCALPAPPSDDDSDNDMAAIRRSATSHSLGAIEARTPRVARSRTQRIDSRGHGLNSTLVAA